MFSVQTASRFEIHKIPHIRQRSNWDCGIACILMLLCDEQRCDFLAGFSRICLEEGFSHATWTIDLCYLLKRFNVKHRMFTANQEPNRAHSEKVLDRVLHRFRNASYHGITVVERALSTEHVVSHVVSSGPAIVLVDAPLLSCERCKHNKLTSELRRMFGGSYQGHYIVVVGWSSGQVLYHNPARSDTVCATSVKRLHAARSSPGTDYDVVLIFNDYLQIIF